jgi:hypothetical protein
VRVVSERMNDGLSVNEVSSGVLPDVEVMYCTVRMR